MFTTNSRREHPSPTFNKIVAWAAYSMMALLTCAGVTAPVTAEDRGQRTPYDRRVLSEIARDVLRNRATGANQSVAQPSLLGWTPGLKPEPDSTVADTEPDEGMTATHIAPAREGNTVPIDRLARQPQKSLPQAAEPAGYHSNSWRRRTDAGRGLSFSSGRLAPASGLDPALAAHANGLRADGRQYVYGFLLLRVPADEAVQNKLAGLDVELLGPHDDHYKARLPIASLRAIAAMREVEWVGVSAQGQKLSSELSALRGGQGQAAVVGPGDPIPIVINLFEVDESGTFRRQLEAAGATLAEYDAGLAFYRAVAAGPAIDRIAALDFVLFIELIGLTSGATDQSTILVDADMIRPGTSLGLTRFSGASVAVGIMDSGFALGHYDLVAKRGCGLNFTGDGTSVFADESRHGTHVLGTMAGSGYADHRYKGVAPGIGTLAEIQFAKIWTSNTTGQPAWMENAMDWMALGPQCGNPGTGPVLVNVSGGRSGRGLTGTDSSSRKLDEKVWNNGQLYVVSAGNGGSPSTIEMPGVAKNALTVGAVLDYGHLQVGDVDTRNSQGPTGDGRMKPNVVAPGYWVTSTEAGTTQGYTTKGGASQATAHVSGLAATLMEHYPVFQFKPALVRAHMMATAIAHDDVTGASNDYGLGRVSGYLAHWDHPNSDGWSTYRYWGTVSANGFAYGDIVVPAGTRRLVVVMTWNEPPASSGASRAVLYDVDLWLDRDVNCADPTGACGEYSSTSTVDNVEYIVVDNPPAGTYRMKVVPSSVPGIVLPWGMTAMIIRGEPASEMNAYLTAPATAPLYSTFDVTATVSTGAYVASAVRLDVVSTTVGAGPSFVRTTRLDGVPMRSEASLGLTLGNVVPTLSRIATFEFVAKSPGPQAIFIRASSENGGEITKSVVVNVVADASSTPDLVETALTTNPAAPIVAPGATFSAIDTVQNAGMARSNASTTRYYLSLDATRSADDLLLAGTHPVPGLDPGNSHSATVTVTIPATTPPNTYFVLSCADDQNAVVESNETNNCIATPGAIVTVARADLAEAVVDDDPTRAHPGARHDVRRDRHGSQPRAGGGRAVDDPLLPLARSGQGRGRRAAGREPRGAWPGPQRRPFRDGDGEHPGDYSAQQLLPAGLRR